MHPIKWRATITQFVLNENSQGCEICLHYKNPKEFLSKLRKLKFSIKGIGRILIEIVELIKKCIADFLYLTTPGDFGQVSSKDFIMLYY